MNPPSHLCAKIDALASALDAQAMALLTKWLERVNRRKDICIEEVVETFCDYQDFINSRFAHKVIGESTLKEHEARCLRGLQIMLYGVVERME